MSKETSRSFVYESIGKVSCLPPALEYKDPRCTGWASLVCHHCKSPICTNCAVLIPDPDFPIFSELEGKIYTNFYIPVVSSIALAILLFPLAYILASLMNVSELSLDPLYVTFQAISLRLPTVPLQISINFLLILVVALVLYATTKICTTYVRKEETPTGKKVLKMYDKKNMKAAHCKYCNEKYHKGKAFRRTAQLIMGILTIVAVLLIFHGYSVGFLELAFPIILISIALSLNKIERQTREKEITPTF